MAQDNLRNVEEITLALVLSRARELRRVFLQVGTNDDLEARRFLVIREFREVVEVFRELVIQGAIQVEQRMRDFLKTASFVSFLNSVDEYLKRFEHAPEAVPALLRHDVDGKALRLQLVAQLDDFILSS